MYYKKVYVTRPGYLYLEDEKYVPLAVDTATLVRVKRQELVRAERVHRTVGAGFLGGVVLILCQVPFTFLGSEALHVTTSILGGLLTLVFGGVWVTDLVSPHLPNVENARTDLDLVTDQYTKELLSGGE